MGKAKKEKRMPDDSGGTGEDLPKVQIDEEHARRGFGHDKRREGEALQRLEERTEQGPLPASDEPSDVEGEDDEESYDAIASHRAHVDRREFVEAVLVFSPSSSEDEAYEEEISSEDVDEEEEIKQEKGKPNEEKPDCLKDVNARHLLQEGAGVKNSDDDDLFQAKPRVVARADRQEDDDDDKKQAMELSGHEVFGNGENESEFQVTHHKKSSNDLILGGQKKEGNKDKSSKNSQSNEGPSSSEPDNGNPMNEQEETNVKGKSTRSGRRKRRSGDLKMSTKRKVAYGIIKPKRPRSH